MKNFQATFAQFFGTSNPFENFFNMPGMAGNQFFNTDGMDGMDKDDPFGGLGGLGSGLGGGFGHGRTPFRSQSFNVGSGTGARKVTDLEKRSFNITRFGPPLTHSFTDSISMIQYLV